MEKYIYINEKDNVAVALADLKTGEEYMGVTLTTDIPEKHKFALTDIKEGEYVVKYGFPIGVAKENIKKGSHIHSHNLKTALTEHTEYSFKGDTEYRKVDTNITFNGYLRHDGRVGIRNRLLVIPTVGCANMAVKNIAETAKKELGIDGIQYFNHPYGCSQLGDDAEYTAKCISALCNHPNVGGALLVSLGCENNNLQYMEKYMRACDKTRIRTLNMQECEDEISSGVKIVEEIYNIIKNDKRTQQPVSKLTLGFKCGGSDGFSGITANPLCGTLCDKLTENGAKMILTEVPEMFGAETRLLDRAENREVFNKGVNLINGFKDYFTAHGQTVYENPSPGNKAGGITTLEEKSLGCITKGGFSTVTDVLDLYEPCKKEGLSLLWGPGNDIVSTTNLASSGAVMILFTTGRGTPLGAPVPTVKISTNTELSVKKKNWIDFNAGTLLDGESFEDATDRLLNYILKVANGEKTLNEQNGIEEIAVFKDGITL